MAGWSRVKWSEARQVLDILRAKEAAASPEAAMAPAAYFDHLRAGDRDNEAAKFLGQALPRLEAVAWAALYLITKLKASSWLGSWWKR